MRIRAVPAVVTGLTLLALAAYPALSADAAPIPPIVLVADGGFDSGVERVPPAWQCGDDAAVVRAPGVPDAPHLVPLTDRNAVPSLLWRPATPDTSPSPVPSPVMTPGAGPTRKPSPPPPTRPPAADFIHTFRLMFTALAPLAAPVSTPPAAPSPGPPVPSTPDGRLAGTPGWMTRAECAQTVPVQPSATYTLTARVRGGQAFLGTEYGVAWTPPSAKFTTLRTTFTTAADAHTVRIHLHGWYGGAAYEADDVVLTGRPAAGAGAAAPTGLTVSRRTSGALRLSWTPVPGVLGYKILQNGVRYRGVLTPWADLSGLAPHLPTTLTVLACTGMERCTPSAPLTVEPLPDATQAPAAPEITGLRPAGGGAIGMVVTVAGGENTTDGYGVYVDGRLAGWTYGPDVFVPVSTGGVHTVEVTGLNRAGESVRSQARTVPVPQP